VAFIAVVLSFFILWLSFTANIRENSWEFGVLRSLGLTVRACPLMISLSVSV
jgi:ABC-type antimicrobial peptide transport system permease subunit